MLFGEHDFNKTKDCNNAGKCLPEPFKRKPAKIIVHEGYDFKKNKGANPNDIGKKSSNFMTQKFSLNKFFMVKINSVANN